ELAIAFSLPIIYTVLSSIFFWRKINRPWFFSLTSLILLFICYGLVMDWTLSAPPTEHFRIVTPPPLFGPLRVPMLIFTLLSLPILYFLGIWFRKSQKLAR
ncbi:hypothetical protein, partial [Herbaspirillum chlorophenolicum]|uniref:hypothetical protein n=1 Tax=Herbaspirillum chlorophenolicum TaxID=211589 RepID=UPI001E574F40